MIDIKRAVEREQLRKYNLKDAKVGDRVLDAIGYGSVIALHHNYVVFGWDSKYVSILSEDWPHAIYLSPLAWAGEVPIYG